MAGSHTADSRLKAVTAVGRVLDLPLHLVDEPAGMVDDWGRDAGLVRHILGLAQIRWNVSVGGDQHLPRRNGALIVVNARRFALAPIFSALAISEAVDRPVRFIGRSDSAPLGPLARRIGGLLDHPDELFGALRAGELVVMGADATMSAREVGRVRHDLVGAATAAGVQTYPAATNSTPVGRSARVEIGQATRPTRKRRGPLAELELADHLRRRIATLLAEMGDIGTGTPLDWLPISGVGGGR